jgi:hypothetical protein
MVMQSSLWTQNPSRNKLYRSSFCFHTSRRRFRFCCGGRLNRTLVNALFVSDEPDRDQNEYHDDHDALFVLRKFENSEQAFHLGVTVCDRSFDYRICHVERSETSLACGSSNQRFFAPLRMTGTAAFHFFA